MISLLYYSVRRRILLQNTLKWMIVVVFLSTITGCVRDLDIQSSESLNVAVKSENPNEASPIFDPRKIEAGDKIGSMTVASYERIRTERSSEGEYVAQAFIQFTGEVEVTGAFKHYPLEREYLGGEIVFQVEENQNFPEMKIRNAPEEIRTDEWIVLSLDEETKRKFGPPGSEGKATLAISDYKIQYGPTEISDHAQLKKIVNLKINNETVAKESSRKAPKVKWLRFDSEGYPSERELIKKEYEKKIKEIERGDHGNVKEIEIAIAREDLNGDGKDEVVVALFHPYFSGYRANCLLQIYTVKDEKLDQQFPLSNANLIADEQGDQQEVGVIDNPGLQWKDIVINRNLWRWDGKKYDFSKKDFLEVNELPSKLGGEKL
ncbi:hypothetical protein ACFCP7_18960 [Paenibacillus elgii]